MKSIIRFLESEEVTINIDNLRSEILNLNRCKRKDQIRTKSISVNRLIKLLKCYKKEEEYTDEK